MNFVEAVRKVTGLGMRDNKLMRRSEKFKVSINEGRFMSNKHEKDWCIYKPSIADMLAEDWHVVKDEKQHTFEEAIVALKNGHTIKQYISIQLIRPGDWCLIDSEDLMANDWIILDKEETK